MPTKKIATTKHIEYHVDGSIWAKGRMAGGEMTGYWEWFRKDGTKSRSGYFENSRQVGEWTTYDKQGGVVKVTMMKPAGNRSHRSAKPDRDRKPDGAGKNR
jgi:antitoxin component YwqK of YwqJK toxin-antitoxin module